MSENTEYFTPLEVVKKLKISIPTFHRKVKSGEIPIIRIGRSIRVSSSFFDSLEAQSLENITRGDK